MKIRIFAVAVVILATIQVHAGGASCSNATSLVPDGRLLDFDNVQPNSSNWYQFTATANRSYSIEVRDDVDPMDPVNGDFQVTYYGPNGTCLSPAVYGATTDTHGTEPALPASSKRVSIMTSSTGGGTYWIQVRNTNQTVSHYVSVMVSETTLFQPYFSAGTTATYNTFYSLVNTTSSTINFSATFINANGTTALASTGNSLLGNAYANPNTNTNTPGNFYISSSSATGYVIFTHNGPPGALIVNATVANFNTTPYSWRDVPVIPIREKR